MTCSPRAGGPACRAQRCRRVLRALALLALVSLGCEPAGVGAPRLAELPPPPAKPDDPASWKPYYEAVAALGDGFVVWESLRDGKWRIWQRALDGSPESQLSPEEPGRDHVAAHVSPDGRYLVYLSLPAPHRDFDVLPEDVAAPLHLLRIEAGRAAEDRVLVPNARPYHQSRAALWVSPRELIYIAGDRTTRQIDVASGAERVLIPSPQTKFGMLVNATHSHATNGAPTFSIYRESDRSVARRKKLAGCQPYFTPDGRYGYWVAGTGGPFRSLDLADGASGLVIDRNSRFLPEGHGYLYYPMMSADQRLLAFSASRNQHGHFDADFDVFVAPLDPATLEVVGTAVRYSFSPGQDRFPDVFVAGNELGRWRGEAPFSLTLHPDPDAPAEGWRFDFGDGTPPGDAPTHVYERPGEYRVTARRGERELGGEVRVAPGAPPRLVRAELRPGGSEIAVLFDERIVLEGAKASLESGAAVAEVVEGDRGRDVVVKLAEPLAADDVLHVEGVVDRADVPHRLPRTSIPVARTPWPGSGEGLAFVFATEGVRSLARDLDTGQDREFGVAAHGRARFDAHGALRTAGGWFEAEDLPKRFVAAFREADAFTLEATVWPSHRDTEEEQRIVSLAVSERSQNASLSQDGTHAALRIRTSDGDEHTHTRQSFGQLDAGQPAHLLVSYRPGRLVAYQDGRKVLDTDAVTGDLSAWRDGARLTFGANPGGGSDFQGRIEGVSLYHRFFEAEEAAAHANAYLHLLAEREPVPRLELKARLLAASVLPTPEQIVPYREALVLNEYEVPEKRRAQLGFERVRVAHWAILDGLSQQVPTQAGGPPIALEIEPWERHPRLESTYLSDTLEPDLDVPLYVDVSD